jgi:glycosyltransferase involved in cell wall biosynthesis
MMDDWPSTLYADKLLAPYLRWKLNSKFQNLLAHSSALMGISPKMSEAYKLRYKRSCLSFHNPLELEYWRNFMKRDWRANTPFRIMYRGRIGTGIQRSLVDICNAVFELFQEGKSLQFDITLTPDCDDQTKRRLERPGCVSVQSAIPYKEIPASLASADLLVLSYDFDPDSVNFIRYSMPTKAPEYMISGTPVLIYGEKELAIIEYAQKEEWGYVVSKTDLSLLKQAIIRLIDDQDLREKLGRRAQELAILNHDAIRVRDTFRQTLNYAVNHPLPIIAQDA